MSKLLKNLINGRKASSDLSQLSDYDLLLYKSETTYFLTKKAEANLNVPYSEAFENYSQLAKDQYKEVLEKIRESYDLYYGGEYTKDEYISEIENIYLEETKKSNKKWIIPFVLLVYMFGKWDIDERANEESIDRLISRSLANSYSYYSENYFKEYQSDIVRGFLDTYDNSDEFNAALTELWEGRSSVTSPNGIGTNPQDYFDSIVLLNLSRARIFGELEAMERLGIQRYRIVEIEDDVTCEFCLGINGTVFNVSDGIELRDQIGSMNHPDDIKTISKWITGKKLEELMNSDGVQGIVDAGLCLPPYHPRCRGRIEPVR